MISVSRWTPGFFENLQEGGSIDDNKVNKESLSRSLVKEARGRMERSASKAEQADKAMSPGGSPVRRPSTSMSRQRIMSTPVSSPANSGGDMFEDNFEAIRENDGTTKFRPSAPVGNRRRHRVRTLTNPVSVTGGDPMFGDDQASAVLVAPGEVLVDMMSSSGKTRPAKISEELYDKIFVSSTDSALMLTEDKEETNFVGSFLEGFIRNSRRNRAISNVSDMEANHA